LQLCDVARYKGNSRAPQRQAITLDGFYRHFDIEECVAFMARAMERAGWDAEELPEHQRKLYRDLLEPLDEEALADMLQYWAFDLDKLYTRERRGWGLGRAPAKPEIDVRVEITSRGNLRAEWFPRGGSIHHTPADSDFVWFRRNENREFDFHSRPSNELLFLHGFAVTHQHALQQVEGPTTALSTPLLAACARVVERIKDRLDYHFSVRMCTDVVVEWDEIEDEDDPWRSRYSLVSWEIINPEERARLAELAELHELEDRAGLSEAALMQAKARLDDRIGKTKPTPAPHTLPERLARELKKQGLPATEGKVKRALSLIERHRVQSNVVSLRG
jgi:hypothetical protein